ncbi:MAG: major capsid protein [Enterobacter sp.]
MASNGGNLTSGFIDLATFDEIEKYQYGSNQAYAYFVRETRKSTWFTQVPVVLSRSSGQAGFNQEWSVAISRAGDYLLHTWLRVQLPSVTLLAGNPYGAAGRIRWTNNFMHNLIKECSISFNDLVAERFDNYFLDFWSAFTVCASKRVGYDNMIGNIQSVINPVAPGVATTSLFLNVPLPLFFTRDSGVALPTAAIPYNEMRITLTFRDWSELLVVSNSVPVAGTNPFRVPVVGTDIAAAPELTNCQVWANYAIVSNEERKRMACAPRDILIEQVQPSPKQNFAPLINATPTYDIRFSYSIKALFFAARNKTNPNLWSNYTVSSPVPGPIVDIVDPLLLANDPISTTSLTYENVDRLKQVGSDILSLVEPFYKSPAIPEVTGYHLYSYSLNFYDIDPLGSTNYGKLTNVSISPAASPSALVAAGGTGAAGTGQDYAQSFEFIVIGLNSNICRISGGAFGFPVL